MIKKFIKECKKEVKINRICLFLNDILINSFLNIIFYLLGFIAGLIFYIYLIKNI